MMSEKVLFKFEDEAIVVVSATYDPVAGDPTRGSVTFVVASDTDEKAYAAAIGSELIDEGTRIARVNGMQAPGLNQRGINPQKCDAEGNTCCAAKLCCDKSDETTGDEAAECEKKLYYYKNTHIYLGDD
jgi:hypothetical protein